MKNTKIFAGLLITLLVVSGCQFMQPTEPTPDPDFDTETETETDTDEDTEVPAVPEPQADNTSMPTELEDPNEPVSNEVADYGEDEPVYTNYSASLVAELHGKKPYAIFFHAPWCPKCVEMEKQFKANLSSLPNGVKILKADYDSETALKAKHGITIQSSVVVFDAKGNVVDTITYTNYETAKNAIGASL